MQCRRQRLLVRPYVLAAVFYLTRTGVCQDHCLILYVYIGGITDAEGVLTFYIPAILDG